MFQYFDVEVNFCIPVIFVHNIGVILRSIPNARDIQSIYTIKLLQQHLDILSNEAENTTRVAKKLSYFSVHPKFSKHLEQRNVSCNCQFSYLGVIVPCRLLELTKRVSWQTKG